MRKAVGLGSGALAMAAPVTADLGSGTPGGTISADLGTVTVTGNRALLSTAWTATALSASFPPEPARRTRPSRPPT